MSKHGEHFERHIKQEHKTISLKAKSSFTQIDKQKKKPATSSWLFQMLSIISLTYLPEYKCPQFPLGKYCCSMGL